MSCAAAYHAYDYRKRAKRYAQERILDHILAAQAKVVGRSKQLLVIGIDLSETVFSCAGSNSASRPKPDYGVVRRQDKVEIPPQDSSGRKSGIGYSFAGYSGSYIMLD
jgi:hypothetical protein